MLFKTESFVPGSCRTLFFKIKFIYCECFGYLYIYVPLVFLVLWRSEEALDSLELKFVIVTHHLGAGDRALILLWSNKCSSPARALDSPVLSSLVLML